MKFKLFFTLGIIINSLNAFSAKIDILPHWQSREDYGSTVIAPFGYSTRQPPSSRTVKIIDARLGFKAQQVCGYTDWTTTQIHLPKQLLSKKYWENVGTQVMKQAQEAVMEISGALPSMLACNVSPTFCNVFNQAEMMASFESDLTFNTCKMLDGIGNAAAFPNEQLANCIKSNTSAGKTASEAREICITGGKSNPTKDEKLSNSSKGDNSKFTIDRFLDSLFPTSVTDGRRTYSLTSGAHSYSRRVRTRSLFKELFPGIEIQSNATIVNGGTFQLGIDRLKDNDTSLTKDFIFSATRAIYTEISKGYSHSEALRRVEKMWSDKEKWRTSKEPSPIHRPSFDDSEPGFIITPNQLVLLTPLIDKENPDRQTETMSLALDRLASSASYVRLSDQLSDILRITSEKCNTAPELQTEIAQRNCRNTISQTRDMFQVLAEKRNAEEYAINNGMLVARMVQEHLLHSSGNITAPKKDTLEAVNKNKMSVPGK